MNNINKLKKIGILSIIRKRIAGDENDTSFDDIINGFSNDEIIQEYCAWKLGYDDHWKIMKGYFDKLESLDKI
jgi:hypothetical protein